MLLCFLNYKKYFLWVIILLDEILKLLIENDIRNFD